MACSSSPCRTTTTSVRKKHVSSIVPTSTTTLAVFLTSSKRPRSWSAASLSFRNSFTSPLEVNGSLASSQVKLSRTPASSRSSSSWTICAWTSSRSRRTFKGSSARLLLPRRRCPFLSSCSSTYRTSRVTKPRYWSSLFCTSWVALRAVLRKKRHGRRISLRSTTQCSPSLTTSRTSAVTAPL